MIRTFYLLLTAFVLVLTGCDTKNMNSTTAGSETEQAAKIELTTDEDKLSYGIGLNIGTGLISQGLPGINKEAIFQGINDALNGDEPVVGQEELEQVLVRLRDKEEARLQAVIEENAAKGAAFLAENGAREGVVTTESGLQYEVIIEGTGEMPTADSVVKTHYHGTLVDGTVFDSSIDRGEPTQFAVNQVIPGWTEALQLMKVGSKWRLYLPADLGYGEMSPGPAIPPNSTLIFDVELLEILDQASEEPADKAEG